MIPLLTKKNLAFFIATGAAGLQMTQTSEANLTLIDDFESYETGNVAAVESPWTSHNNNTQANAFLEEGSGNRVLGWGFSNNFRTASRPLGEQAIASGDIATFFTQIRINANTINQTFFGLTNDPDTSLVNNAADIGSLTGIRSAEAPTQTGAPWNFEVFQEGLGWNTLTTVDDGTWYNVWYVIDYASDTMDPTYKVYLNTGTAAATESDRLSYGSVDTFTFRPVVSGGVAIDHVIVNGGAVKPTNTAHLDNLWMDNTGENLANPIPEPRTYALFGGIGALLVVLFQRGRRRR